MLHRSTLAIGLALCAAGVLAPSAASAKTTLVAVPSDHATINRLEALGQTELRFTVEADMGHDVWARVYAGSDVYDWMLAHRKVGGSPAAAAP